MTSIAENATRQFYAWECRGRGWHVADSPVDLEPPFVPFFPVTWEPPNTDDGRVPTLWESLAAVFSRKPNDSRDETVEDVSAIQPYPFDDDAPLVGFRVWFPKGCKIGMTESEQLLAMLSCSRYPVSFEIIATGEMITVQIVCRDSDALHTESQIRAYFPEAFIERDTDRLHAILPESGAGCAVDFGLKDEFMRPLQTLRSLDVDPYTGLFGIFDSLHHGEHAVLQILFTSTYNPWAQHIMRSVTGTDGGPFFQDAPEMLPMAKEKVASPLFAVTVRVLGFGRTEYQAYSIVERLAHGIVRSSRSEGNMLIPLSGGQYPFETLVEDVLYRRSHRLGMLLNGKELAALAHFPSASVTSSKLHADARKTKAAPSLAIGHQLVLGKNVHQGVEAVVSLSPSLRSRHLHIIGATGTGKSNLLLNCIVQDIHDGHAICVIDPHGDLIDQALLWIDPSRREDIIIIDPADAEFPVGFNILSAHSDVEKEVLSSDLVAIFRRLSTSWGDQMHSVFSNAVIAFLESSTGGTLADLRRFLVEKPFREQFLAGVADPNIVYYWQKEFPILKSGSIGPILTRLDTFLRPKLIRNMVTQKKGLDFAQILDSGKVLLVKLSQGLIGEENSYLLGSLIVAKIQQAAMARQAQRSEDRKPFYLYIDEFHHFVTPSLSAILSGARKYNLGLILAHQDMAAVAEKDGQLANSIMTNAGTRVSFRVGEADARKIAAHLSFFDVSDLMNLNTGEAIVKIERPMFDCNITAYRLPEPEAFAYEEREEIIEWSRQQYGTPRNEVEAQQRELYGIPEIAPIEKEKETIKPIEVKQEPVQQEEIVQQVNVQPELTEAAIAKTKQQLVKRKEQSEHRYLQTFIKRMAEARGYRAVIEDTTPDGTGRVDVALYRDQQKIACEISITTPDVWELHNVEKCLAAGFAPVIVCGSDPRHLDRIRKRLQESLDTTLLPNVSVMLPEELVALLDTLTVQELSTEKRIKGYRVKVEYEPVKDGNADVVRQNILKMILKKSNDPE